jgi:2-methylisocitrate lyase-like PEP mutase family enzyme
MPESLNKQLKTRLARRDAMLLPGCPNALAARIAEDLGFEAAYVTGAGVTNMFLGLPDLSFVNLSQIADHVAAMREATNLPLIVDADTGFGNAVHVGRTVKVLERAGASCIQLEDQVFPKRCGHFDGKEVIPTDEFVGKIKAAADARTDPDFLIMARTDAIACTGFEDAVERANAALEAGADCLFIEGPRSREEIERIPRSADAPMLINLVYGGNTPILTQQDLRQMGYAMVLYANAALQAAITAMQRTLGEIKRTGSIEGVMSELATFEERQRLVNKPLYDALEQRYATEG